MTDRAPLDRPTLTTERLVLRRPAARDADAIVATVGDAEVARRLSRVPHPYRPADAAFFLDEIVPFEWTWAITQRGAITAKDSDTLIGSVGLTPGETADTAELGYWLARPCWGRGLVTEAARVVVGFGFNTLRLPAITSGYFANNPASGRVLEKLGFVETGRAMRPCLAQGREVPSVEMRLPAP